MESIQNRNERLLIAMVGLPARGKSYISRKLCRYLTWLGFSTKSFNIGSIRRSRLGPETSLFFDPDNPSGVEQRNLIANEVLGDLLNFLALPSSQIGIFDGTNVTRERQERILSMARECGKKTGLSLKVVFLEVICTDEKIIEENIKETKLTSPDYAKMNPEEAVADFRKRIAHYEREYATLSNSDWTYIKLFDYGRQVIVNRSEGYILGRIVFFLMHLRGNKQPIFFTRHGESEYNVEDKIGGDSPLSTRGKEYAAELAKFVLSCEETKHGLKIWCSTLKRTLETASYISLPDDTEAIPWRALSEIEVGTCDGMTYKEIEHMYPEEFAARSKDKLRYRYPRGESYFDVIQRLEPVIFELERATTPILVVSFVRIGLI
jgi:broad specificity phosphatase PhoE